MVTLRIVTESRGKREVHSACRTTTSWLKVPEQSTLGVRVGMALHNIIIVGGKCLRLNGGENSEPSTDDTHWNLAYLTAGPLLGTIPASKPF